MNKYQIYCETDNKWKTVIATALPTVCPINGEHTVRGGSACLIQSNILINDGAPTNLTLNDYKQLRFNEIDAKTGQLIAPGFIYDAQTFSTSANAQINWSSIKDSQTDYIFPLEITTKDNNVYSLAEADVVAFWTAGRDFVLNHLDSGRALKKQVFDATDKAGVDTVIDNR